VSRADAPSILEQSAAYKVYDHSTQWLDRLCLEFFRQFDGVFWHSMLGQLILRLRGFAQNAIPVTFIFRKIYPVAAMAVAPWGESLTADTAIGVSLAAGCVLPTEFVFILAFGAFGLVLWERVKSSPDNENANWVFPRFQIGLPLLVIFMFLVGATLSSVVPRVSIYNLAIWCLYGLFLLVGVDAGFRGKADKLLWPVFTGSTFAGLVGIYQRLSGWTPPRSWLDESFEEEIVRVVGTFDNPQFLAEMLGLTLPIVIALILKRKDIRDKLYLTGCALVQGYALILTSSRGAWLGFIASFALMAVLYERRLLAVGMVLVLVAAFLAPEILVQRLLSAFSFTDSSNSYRISIWRGSLALARSHLLRGVGLGAESFAKMYPEYMIVQTPAPHAHSTYLQMLIEVGLFGFLAFVWFFLVWLYDAFRTLFTKGSNEDGRWTNIGTLAAALAAVAGHLLQAIVEYTWYSPRVTVVFWVLIGLSSGIALLQNHSMKTKDGAVS
jgi:putative inorganic carbon (HCO3(-)) transporter